MEAKNMQVLVVEDERRMAELLRQGLEEEGHSVVLADNGRDGLEMAESHPFDAIVLDVMLPGMDGFSVARKLRAARNQTPILMLTARDATHDIVEGLNLGADDYLVKPFSFEVLLARLRAVSRRGAIAQPPVLAGGRPCAQSVGARSNAGRAADRSDAHRIRPARTADETGGARGNAGESDRIGVGIRLRRAQQHAGRLHPAAARQSGPGRRNEANPDRAGRGLLPA